MSDFMYLWSWLFSPIPAAFLFVAFALILAFQKQIRDAATVLLAGLATAGAVFVLKDVVARPRPNLNPALWADDFSFPSGHAAAAACFSALLIWFLPQKYRNFAMFPAIALALLVGASRVYFGVHYLTDVLAGYGVGIAVTVISLVVDRRLKMR